MKVIQQDAAHVFTIRDAAGLDPITVTLMDFDQGRGNFIVECYGTAWATYWNAMGEGQRLATFILRADTGYIVTRLRRPRELKREEAYLTRIVEAIKAALKQEADSVAPAKLGGEQC